MEKKNMKLKQINEINQDTAELPLHNQSGPEMHTNGEYMAPVTPIEKSLVTMEQNLFGFKQIGTTDDFFIMGGNSNKAIRLISLVYAEFGIELQLGEIFEARTIRDLSRLIENRNQTEIDYPQLEKTKKKDLYDLSYEVYLSSADADFDQETRFNMGRVEIITGKLDVSALEKAFKTIIERHDAFRMSFHYIDGSYWFKVADTVPFSLDFIHCSEDDAQKKMGEFVQIFDTGTAPLLRASVLQVAEDRYYYFVDIHHHIFDGEALGIFDEEIWKIYRGETLEPLPFQYKDYLVWLNTLYSQGIMEKHKAYWMQKLQGFNITRLPPDNRDTEKNSQKCGKERFIIDSSGYQAIDTLCREWNITKPCFIISSFLLLFAKETGEQDLILGMWVSNRFDPRLDGIVGCFLEHAVLRSQLTYNETAHSFFNRTNTIITEAVDHGLYPSALLREEIGKLNSAGNKELFHIMVNYIEDEGNPLFMSNDLHREKFMILKTDYTAYDINFKIIDNHKDLVLQFKYKCSLFSRMKIKSLLTDFKQLINEVLGNKNCTIDDLIRKISA